MGAQGVVSDAVAGGSSRLFNKLPSFAHDIFSSGGGPMRSWMGSYRYGVETRMAAGAGKGSAEFGSGAKRLGEFFSAGDFAAHNWWGRRGAIASARIGLGVAGLDFLNPFSSEGMFSLFD